MSEEAGKVGSAQTSVGYDRPPRSRPVGVDPQTADRLRQEIQAIQKESVSQMTLRDFFSAAALTGLANGLRGDYGRVHGEGSVTPEQNAAQAKRAYGLADAMLREREGGSDH